MPFISPQSFVLHRSFYPSDILFRALLSRRALFSLKHSFDLNPSLRVGVTSILDSTIPLTSAWARYWCRGRRFDCVHAMVNLHHRQMSTNRKTFLFENQYSKIDNRVPNRSNPHSDQLLSLIPTTTNDVSILQQEP
jgi:hypothetical protein